MKYRDWIVPKENTEIPSELTKAGYPPLLAALLAIRGIEAPEDAASFLDGGSELLEDPMLLRDMDKAASRVRQAIDRREKVAVFGDYDVDGITSSCLVASYLRSKGLDCEIYIPDRLEEGYGLNRAAIETIAAGGTSLIITVDCGITALDEARFARELGIDMVITDHHECGAAELPVAWAVVNPKRPDCTYPNGELAGVGVAFKLVCAVEGDPETVLEQYADLVATGTVADVMPLTGENRYIVRRGLEMLSRAPRLGISALLRQAGADGKKMNASAISFTLAPRINAAGRLGRADVAVRLLTTQSSAEADALAEELCDLNRERQALEQDIWLEARSKLEGQAPSGPIVLAAENWHQGVIGIAASKLSEEYTLPTVMICLDGDMGKGSCRSVGDFNLFDALVACSEHLVSFGGHALAAGLTIRRDQVDGFRAALGRYYAQTPCVESAALECELRVSDPRLLSMENTAALERMEPFGTGNVRPTLYMDDVLVERIVPIGGGKHLRINIRKGANSFECVLFSRTAEELGLREGQRADVAFFPQINEFRGRRSVQLLLTDVRPTDTASLCGKVLDGDEPDGWEASELCPTRSDCIKTWRWLEQSGDTERSAALLAAQSPSGMHPAKFALCLRVMEGERLLSISKIGERYSIHAVPRSGKADLERSPLLCRLREKKEKFEKGR